MEKQGKTHLVFKVVYGVHVSLTVITLLATIYLALELQRTQVDVKLCRIARSDDAGKRAMGNMVIISNTFLKSKC